MASPKIVYDGDFSKAKQVAPDEFRYPFFDKGDDESFEVVQRLSINAPSYRAFPVMTLQQFTSPKKGYPENCYLVDEGQPTDAGQGRLEFTRTWARVPKTRSERSSIVWPYSLWWVEDSSYGTGEIQLNMACRIQYEYSTSVPSTENAPSVQVINNVLYRFGGFGTITPGTEVLAKGSEVSIYKGLIYVKQSVFVVVPNPASGPPA